MVTIFVLALLIFALALLSGAEAAILSVNRLRAKHRADLGDRRAKAITALLARRADFLPVILALETLLTVAISTIGTALAQDIWPGTQTLFVSALTITLVVLSFGEIVPKTIAIHKPDRFAYLAAPAILLLTRLLSKLLHPFTWLLGHMVDLVGHEAAHSIPTETELKYLISLSREHGILQKEEEELLQNIFDFTDSKVGEIMVPRTQVESLETDSSVQDALDKFARTQFSRFPVQEKTLDHIVGVVDVREILLALTRGNIVSELTPFIKPAIFVPESKRVGKLLQEMRHEHFQFAIVIDEYGGTAGAVSLTDLLEEIVGTLEKKSPRQEIRPIDEKTLIVPASTDIEEVEERLGIVLEKNDVKTIGGLVFALFGRVPEQGEQVRYQNVKFTVTQKDGYRIEQVLIAKEGAQDFG